jgi:hypothetical protein
MHFYREEVAGLVPGAWNGFACAAAVTAAMYLAEVYSYIVLQLLFLLYIVPYCYTRMRGASQY